MPQTYTLFLYLFILTVAWNIIAFTRGSIKAVPFFREHQPTPVLFIERFASGCSMKSFITRIGGASTALEVSVRGQEVWIRGILPMLTYIGFFFDLTHRIPKENISRVETIDDLTHLHFTDSSDGRHELSLRLKSPENFIKALDL